MDGGGGQSIVHTQCLPPPPVTSLSGQTWRRAWFPGWLLTSSLLSQWTGCYKYYNFLNRIYKFPLSKRHHLLHVHTGLCSYFLTQRDYTSSPHQSKLYSETYVIKRSDKITKSSHNKVILLVPSLYIKYMFLPWYNKVIFLVPSRRAGTLWVLEGQNLEGGTFVWGSRRGSEATERGGGGEDVGGGFFPSHGRDFF